jgi:hypothetical protein
LVLTLRAGFAGRLDVSALTPHRLAGLSVDEVKALHLHAERERVAVGEVFSVRGKDVRSIRAVPPLMLSIPSGMFLFRPNSYRSSLGLESVNPSKSA